MFYVVAELTNPNCDVGAVWTIANGGTESGSRKMTRKAILKIDVRGACRTIGEPGAPLALRLQGNLLYGVTRTYAFHCNYVLADAEKIHASMLTYLRGADTLTTDPRAGKVKRHQIVLDDDPNFDIMSHLPALEIDFNAIMNASQVTAKTSSQMSPYDGSASSASIVRLPHTHLSEGEAHSLPFDPFQDDSRLIFSSRNPKMAPVNKDPFTVGLEEDPFVDLGINFDAEGNLLPEGQLPELPGSLKTSSRADVVEATTGAAGAEPQPPVQGPTEDIYMLPEDRLPEAEALPANQGRKANGAGADWSEAEGASKAVPKRSRRRHPSAHLWDDKKTEFSREEYKASKICPSKHMAAEAETLAQLRAAAIKRNATATVFGAGLGGVGRYARARLEHPLAQIFAGDGLRAALGMAVSKKHMQPAASSAAGRRSAAEAFGSEDGARRVKPRTDIGVVEQQQQGDNIEGDITVQIEDARPETGRVRAGALDDHHMSSTLMRHRQSSVVPGSAQKPSGLRVSASPLLKPRAGAQPIERFSDRGDGSNGDSAGNGSGLFPDSSQTMMMTAEDGDALHPTGQGQGAQDAQGGRDTADNDVDVGAFLELARARATTFGYFARNDTKPQRKWVHFDRLVDSPIDDRKTAVRCFYHVLCAATRNEVAVRQDGVTRMEPFGDIRVGIEVGTKVIPDSKDENSA